MITAGLSLEQAPPLAAPLRFFLTAPLHLFAAGVLMLWYGPEIFATRWSPATLALAHLVTLGFAAQCMCGALLQVLPVVAGAPVARPLGVARVTHLGLNLGTAALVTGFLAAQPGLLRLAALLLAIGLGTMVIAGLLALLQRRAAGSPTVAGVRLALAGLALTVVLGALLALTLSGGPALPLLPILAAHVAWGLLGWILALLVAVAYQVVPMFQMTPPYPRTLSRWLLPALVAGLVLRSLADWLEIAPAMRSALDAALALPALVFAAGTLWLQQRRRRRLRDATVMFWQLAMLCLIGATLLWLAGLGSARLADDPRWPLALGVLMLGGFALSVIAGMLYKIVPFLVWFHLQAAGRGAVRSTKDVIADRAALWHYALHALALALLLGAALWPRWLCYPAAVLTLAAAAALGRNLLSGATRLRGRSASVVQR